MKDNRERSSKGWRGFRDIIVRLFQSESESLAVGPIVGVVVAFLVVRWCSVVFGFLDQATIEDKNVTWGILNGLIEPGLGTIALIFGGIWIFVFRRRIFLRWSELPDGKLLRMIVGVIATVVGWMYTTYDYNFYLNSFQLIDRFTLLILVVAVWFRPVFVFPVVVQAIGIASQFMYPIGGYSWAVQDQGLHLLIGFFGFYLVWCVFPKIDGRVFLFFSLCLIAIHYFPSGMSKVQKGWILNDSIEYLIPNAFANGWFNGWSVDSINALTDWLSKFALPLKIATVVLECGGVALLLNRKLGSLILVGWILFHASIYLLTGILFWQWMIIETLFLVVFWRGPRLWIRQFFGVRTFIYGVLFVASSVVWLKPVALTWFDARATYQYRIMAETESGRVFQLPPEFFAPYDYVFTAGGFHYLSEEKALPIGWGATNRATSDAFYNVDTPDSLLEFETTTGAFAYNEGRAETFASFMSRYIGNVNRNVERRNFLWFLSAPRLAHNSSKEMGYDYTEAIKSIRVVRVLSFYGENGFEEITRRDVLSLEL
ncbi:hypothetical protein MLD52_01310 [Puniceicoccaceae bacterium K14]|nr:hypothetical protein [Puniceicoccaceae bacterium K14]